MKTYHASRTSQINRERYGKGLLTAVLVVAGICAFVHQGFTQDLKSFAQAESYLADGQLTTLTQKLGQAVIQFDPSVTTTAPLDEITASNGARFVLEANLRKGRGVYLMQTGQPITETCSAEALASLNSDSRVGYAYPVFAHQQFRHFFWREERVTCMALVGFGRLRLSHSGGS